MQFPERYARWLSHDLARYRPPLYAQLASEDEPVFWRWLEVRYLSRYREFIQLQGCIDGAGAWALWFPGSVSRRYFISAEQLNLSAPLREQLQVWRDDLERGYIPWSGVTDSDSERFDERGLALAKRIKLEVGAAVYVEYFPFQEIEVIDGQAVEMPAPDVAAICRECKKGMADSAARLEK
jgi:hypothetical protein